MSTLAVLVATAKPWHYWLAPILTIMAAVGILATLAGYYIKVISNKYPKR